MTHVNNELNSPRLLHFVCGAVSDTHKLIFKTIEASSPEEASKIFLEECGIYPQEISDPFRKIKIKPKLEPIKYFKFNTERPRQAFYNGWIVNSFLLAEPKDHAFLIFLKREDNKSMPMPKGTTIVPICNLRFKENNE